MPQQAAAIAAGGQKRPLPAAAQPAARRQKTAAGKAGRQNHPAAAAATEQHQTIAGTTTAAAGATSLQPTADAIISATDAEVLLLDALDLHLLQMILEKLPMRDRLAAAMTCTSVCRSAFAPHRTMTAAVQVSARPLHPCALCPCASAILAIHLSAAHCLSLPARPPLLILVY